MMNNYIEIEMLPTAYGVGGSFQTEASFKLDNFHAPFYDIGVKIDTGCSISTIPLKRLKVSDILCKMLKGMDISNNVPFYISYGVESGGLKHKNPVSNIEKMECPAMKFVHRISDFIIAGMNISCDKICLNYDRKGNILIGMDILQYWDIHMGISNITGKNMFVATSKDSISDVYLARLNKHFGI